MKPRILAETNWWSMKKKLIVNLSRIALLLTVATLVACSTVSSPLTRMGANFEDVPTDSLRAVALRLETSVAAENMEPSLAAEGGVIIDTPEIAQACRSRAARYPLVVDLLNTGFIMEQRDGKISILRSGEYKGAFTSAQKDRHALIVISENRDRYLIYSSIQTTNNYSAAGRSAIEEIFAEVRIQNLSSEQKYQGPDGTVLKKD